MQAESSLQERLRAAKVRKERNEIVRVPIPGYGEKLIGVYAQLPWQKRVETRMKATEMAEGGDRMAEALWELASERLLEMSKTTELADNGTSEDLQMKLGLALAAAAGCDVEGMDSDKQALSALFDEPDEVIDHFNAVMIAQEVVSAEVDDKLVGESKAVS